MVINRNGNVSNSYPDKGTYNYVKDTSSIRKGWTAKGEHGRWDMNSYFRQFGITP